MAALRPCAVEVQLGEWLYLIPERPASDWIEAIVDPEGGSIVPGLMDETTRRDVVKTFLRGGIDRDELANAWKYALEAATGQRWWSAARLFLDATREAVWPAIHGKLLLSGLDLEQVSVGAAYNAIYRIALEGCQDQSERAKMEFDLAQPPPGVSAEEAHDKRGAAQDFLDTMQMLRQFDEGRTPA